MIRPSYKSILAIIFILVLSLLLPALSAVAVSDNEQKLTASDGGPDDRFGASVSISSNTLVVGAYLDDDNGENSGSAYVFERISGTWTQIAKLKASDGEEGDNFGVSVSISNDTVVVGVPQDGRFEPNVGSAYIFYRDKGGPDNWGQVKKITARDDVHDFGLSVSINGDTLVVGTFTKSAYIFYRNNGGLDNWGQVKKITSSGPDSENFGESVSISDDTVVVGALFGDGNEPNTGSAYIFYRDRGGFDNWGEVQKLIASDGDENDHFGISVSISDDTVVVGALFGDGNEPNTGSAYIFYRDRGGSDNWGEVKKLTASDGDESDHFGRSISQSGNTVVVGTDISLVYIFDSDQGGPDNWGEVKKLTASDGGPDDRFGASVSISSNTLVVGAPHGEYSGSAYVYALDEIVNDLTYTPVTPCRIVDTRKTSAGIIGASTQRNFRVYGTGGTISAQGGNSAGCDSPLGEPFAAHINMVAVNPTGKGNLQAFPVGAGTGAGLSVNYNTIDTNLANAGTVKTVTGTGLDITVASNFSSAHTVIDVLGYYYPDEGFYYTPVDPCRIADTRKTAAGIIGASTQRDFRVFGPVSDQGGNPAGCPSTLGVSPEAAHLNMIAVNPTGKGNLQAFPVGAGVGAGLSVNYNTIDTNLANAGTVKTVTGSGADITVASNFSSAHTVIDVLGFYSEEEDLLYTPVKPCRIIDTRKTGAGIIDANTQRNFRVFGSVGSQGGNSSGCSSPGGQPRAAHINMIAVDPTGKGNLQAFPVGAGAGAGLSVNYNTIDTNLANAGTVKTITGSGPDITVRSNFSSVHTVIDVLGYYYPAP